MTCQISVRGQFWWDHQRDWGCQNSSTHIPESVLYPIDGWWRDERCKQHSREHLLWGLPRHDLQRHQNGLRSVPFGARYCDHSGSFALSWLVYLLIQRYFDPFRHHFHFSAMRLKETVDWTYRELCDIKDALKSPTDPEMSPDESEKWSLLYLVWCT